MGGRFQEGLVGGTRVFQNPKSIPAFQVPYFASCVVDCLHNSEHSKVFDWKVPQGVFQEGFVQDQAGNLSLTCDYFNSFFISQVIPYLGEETSLDCLYDINQKTYIDRYFCNSDACYGGKFMDTGKVGSTHDREAQKYLLDSQNYRAFYDFDREVWNLIKEIIADARKMYQDGRTLGEVGTFLTEVLNRNIIGPYNDLIRDVSTTGPKNKKFEISYSPEGRAKKTLILLVRDIPYEDYKYHRNGG